MNHSLAILTTLHSQPIMRTGAPSCEEPGLQVSESVKHPGRSHYPPTMDYDTLQMKCQKFLSLLLVIQMGGKLAKGAEITHTKFQLCIFNG